MPQVAVGAALIGGTALVNGTLALSTLTGVSAALVQFGTGMIISGIASEITQAFMPDAPGGPASRNVSVRQPIPPREFVYGATRKGGPIVFLHETKDADVKNRSQLHLVIAVAAHEVNSIGAVYFNGKEAVSAAGVVSSKYRKQVTRYVNGQLLTGAIDHVFVEKRLGASDQTALTQLQVDAPSKWTADHRLRGIAHVHIRLLYNPDTGMWADGLPDISFDVEGKADIFDPRDSQTKYTANAALCIADYMSLPSSLGLGLQYGQPRGINTAALIEAANVCDESVNIVGGDAQSVADESGNELTDESGNILLSTKTSAGSEPRYECNGVFNLEQTPADIIGALSTAMAGKVAFYNGDWKIRAGAYRIPEHDFTETDIREGGITLSTRISRQANFNGIRGQFVSPENDWQTDDYPAYQSSIYVSEDGGRELWGSLVLPFTTSASCAQRLAKIKLERNRRQQSMQLSCKLSGYRAAPTEAINFNYDRWGFSNKPFEVENVTLDLDAGGSGLVVNVATRETSPLVYSWTATEEQIYEAAPRTTLPSAFDVGLPGQPQLVEDLYITRNGAGVRALINVTWTAPATGDVVEYQVQARRTADLNGNPTNEEFLTLGRTDQLRWQIRDVQPGTWEVQVKAISEFGSSSDYNLNSAIIFALTAPPADISGLKIQTAGGLAVLEWERVEDLDVIEGGRIIIRHSNSGTPTWANSVFMKEVSGSGTIGVVPLKPGTYLLRAEDSSGNKSVNAVSVQTAGAQAIGFANLSSLTAEPTWSGTKTNTEVDGTSLKLTSVASEGTYEFATTVDLTTVKTVRLRSDIDVSALELNSTIDDRLDPIDTWADFDGADGAEVDVIVEARVTNDDPSGTPVWSDWSRVDSTEIETRGIQWRARLSTASEDYNVFLSGLTVTADEVA